MFLGKGLLKICSKFTGEHPCRSAISINLESKSIQITLWHGCHLANLLQISRTPFPKNPSDGLLLFIAKKPYELFGKVNRLKMTSSMNKEKLIRESVIKFGNTLKVH